VTPASTPAALVFSSVPAGTGVTVGVVGAVGAVGGVAGVAGVAGVVGVADGAP